MKARGEQIDIEFRLLEIVFDKFQQPDKIILPGGFYRRIGFQIP